MPYPRCYFSRGTAFCNFNSLGDFPTLTLSLWTDSSVRHIPPQVVEEPITVATAGILAFSAEDPEFIVVSIQYPGAMRDPG